MMTCYRVYRPFSSQYTYVRAQERCSRALLDRPEMNSSGRQRQLQQAMESANLQKMWSNLSSRSVKEPGHVMELSIADLIHLGQGTHEQAEAAMLIAARLLAPRCTPLPTQLHAELSSQALTLGIPDIDSALGGGLLTSSITELVGSAGEII